MLAITLKKLLAKRWMFLCMLLGCVLLIATIISLPLYENAVFDKMLQDQFKVAHESTGVWPAKYFKEFQSKQRTGGAEIIAQEGLLAGIENELGVTTKESIRLYKTVARQLSSTMNRDDDWAHEKIQISMLSDLGEHAEVLAGEMYSEDGYTSEGYLEVVITRDAMVDYGYLKDEVLEFKTFNGLDGNPMRIKIVGIVQPREGDLYWEIGQENLENACYISEKAFRELFLGVNDDYLITCYHCYLFEYDELRSNQSSRLLQFAEEETYEVCPFGEILEVYEAKVFRISATLLILQIPMLLLLAAFLFMISKQMFEVERNEIAVIKSRGSSSGQLFRLYFYQTGILVILGLLLGIPLGIGFMQLLGSASGFLEFGVRRFLRVIFDGKVFLYLIAAVMLIVGIMSIPAVGKSRLSIVNLKQHRARKKRAFWERYFLDIACLVVGGYGYYHFSEMEERIAASVIANEPLNPILYISSTLMIVGLGLLYLRLLPLMVMLLYKLGEKKWNPGTYASFLEMMRSNSKQHFILLFLILSIAFGIYHATVAQTIMDNAVENAEYLAAADVIIAEEWRDNTADMLADMVLQPNMKIDKDVFGFYEPNDTKYNTIKGVRDYTKVYYDDTTEETSSVTVTIRGTEVAMMLIHPKKFGEMTWVDRELLDEHYYAYLNKLVDDETGFIVSSNFAGLMGYQVGSAMIVNYKLDMLQYSKLGVIHDAQGTAVDVQQEFTLVGKILGIVDYWPGFVPQSTYLDEHGNVYTRANYLIVGSYFPFEDRIADKEKPQPYEVWIDMEEDADFSLLSDWVLTQDMNIVKYQTKQRMLNEALTDPLLQGTGGVLTMEFVVTILLCGIGYLVYWMMSIRDRELLFGIFRAFGMHKGEVFGMLLLEQLLSGVLTIVAAVGIGKIVCELFAPLMLATYSAAQQVLPMEIAMDGLDKVRLYGSIGLVLVSCMIILIRFVFKMNVAEALKLGED